MRFPSDIALHALQLAKYGQENNMNNPASLAMFLPLSTYDAVQGMVPEGRRLEETTSMKGSVTVPLTQGNNFDFLSAMQNPYFDKIKKCGVNLDDIGSTIIAENLFPSAISEEDTTQTILAAFGNDVTQPKCTRNELMTYAKILQELMKCTHVDQLMSDLTIYGSELDLMSENIDKKCTPVSDNLAPLVLSELGLEDVEEEDAFEFPSMEEMNQCLGSIFGPKNFIGKFVRNIYENPKRFCDCTQEAAAKLPDCTIDEDGITFSLGIFETEACALGVACEQYEEHCTVENSVLDGCLPDLESDDIDCTGVMRQCVMNGSVFAIVPPLLSTTLPDICQDAVTPEVSKRYTAFQQKCKGKKDYFGEEFNEAGEVVMKAPALSLSSQAIYVKKEDSDEKDDSNEKVEASSTSHKFALAGTFVFIVAAALVAIKKKMDDRDDFTPLSTNGLDFEAA